ncbi:MFS transporter [Nocardioides szechwanensis]|uniref:Major Facilitator Superfamily protein n=1 Tax=Nocardioides szechwanensis TaxID=1005944 RepID=A0A1H0I596_9ACTN|nr:MFS transporter [Nocardioides szechwanensis]GEP34401.1 MFS transporter [Nocardioides szechwanensis]SDO26644.1 Major Facilitator Superfamily protein [Nocardioides szechwanensis]
MRLLPEEPAVRRMALATLVNTTGNGIFFTLSALYFTRIVGFSVLQVGTGLSIAAGVALFAGVPIGHLADRRGPREVQVALVLVIAGLASLYLLVTEWWQFVLVSTLIAVLDRGAGAVRGALIAGLVQGAARSSTRAYLRSVTNVGMTIGTGVAAIALHFDTREAYLVVLYVDVATYVVTAGLMALVPHVPPRPAGEALAMLSALRDLPFVAVAGISSVVCMHYWILELAIPLWVVNHTEAPRSVVAILMVINTVTVVLAQVAVAKRVATVEAAVRATVLSGVLFLGACALFGVSGGVSAGLAVALLVVGSLVHVAGELAQASASFLLGFELPPEEAMGQYQGVWGMSFSISSFLAPTVLALLPLALGLLGWLLLGGILLAAALATGPAVGWAVRSKENRLSERVTTREYEE